MISNQPTKEVAGVPMSFWEGVGGAQLHLVHTPEEWKAFYGLMKQQKLVACDTETTGFDWYLNHELCGLSFGWKDMHFYVPIRHKPSLLGGDPPAQLTMDEIKPDLIDFFSDTTRTTVWHNAKFDMLFYSREGIQIHTKIQDTRILWHFYDENAPGALKVIASGWKDEMGQWHKGLISDDANSKETDLDDWRTKESRARRETFRHLVMAEADKLGKSIEHQDKSRLALKAWIAKDGPLKDHPYKTAAKEDIDYSYIPVSLMTEYAALDTFLTYKLYEFTVKNIQWNTSITALYKNEMAMLRVLFEAEEHGVRIDRNALLSAGVEFEAKINELRESILGRVGNINLQSTKQLAEALTTSGVKLTKMSDSSTEEDPKFALDKKVLSKLKGKHDVIADILTLREWTKINNTYVDSIISKLTHDNVLHCSFNQNVKTGRMSSRDPNLQNIPAKDKTIRKAFMSWNDDYIYVLADYSQIEVRLTAHYSQDKLLLDAYAKNQDIHTRTFCEMFGYNIDEVSAILNDPSHQMHEEFSVLRVVAKRINFGIIYGVGAPGLSEQVERPAQYKNLGEDEWVEQCQEFINKDLDKYVGVRRFVNQGNRLVAKDAQVTNYFGRVRHLPNAHATRILNNSKLYWMEKRAQRQGVNFLIQGTAADLFKIAVVRIANILRGTRSKLVNFVHDEVQIYLHKEEMYLLPAIKKAMEAWNFSVPIIADFSQANPSWGSKKKLEF